MPFVKGQSGNLKGRPKKSEALIIKPFLVRMLHDVVMQDDGEGGTLTKQNRELLAAKLLSMALNGDMEAIKVILDRVDGKVPAPVADLADDRVFRADDLIRAALRERDRVRAVG